MRFLGNVAIHAFSFLMYCCSYDVVLTARPQEVVAAFNKFDAGVVFSAEAFCWPDISLAVRVLSMLYQHYNMPCNNFIFI
jgi:hypothetical protein